MTLREIVDYTGGTYGLNLSVRKLKMLQEHGWIGRDWGVVPWGFFRPPVGESQILYEDDELLGVYKPPFITVVSPADQPSLFSLWKKRVPGLRAVHRLDFETSGVVVFAKTARMYETLRESFKHRQVDKTYVLIMRGCPRERKWQVSVPIEKIGSRVQLSSRGQAAQTVFEVQETFSDERLGELSLLVAKPLTGRRHQIRLHLQHSGYRLVGEPQYGGCESARKSGVRMQLHGQRLALEHVGKTLNIVCPYPIDFIGNSVIHSVIP